jgi:hypothetical protein
MDSLFEDASRSVFSYYTRNINDLYKLSRVCKSWRLICRDLIKEEKRAMIVERFFSSCIDISNFRGENMYDRKGGRLDLSYNLPNRIFSLNVTWIRIPNEWLSPELAIKPSDHKSQNPDGLSRSDFFTFHACYKIYNSTARFVVKFCMRWYPIDSLIMFYQNDGILDVEDSLRDDSGLEVSMTKLWFLEKLFVQIPVVTHDIQSTQTAKPTQSKMYLRKGDLVSGVHIPLHSKIDIRYSLLIDLYNWTIGQIVRIGDCVPLTNSSSQNIIYEIIQKSDDLYYIKVTFGMFSFYCEWNYMTNVIYIRDYINTTYVNMNIQSVVQSIFLEIPHIVT